MSMTATRAAGGKLTVGGERIRVGPAWVTLVASAFLLEITLVVYVPRFEAPQHFSTWLLPANFIRLCVYVAPAVLLAAFLGVGALLRVRPGLADMPNRYYWLAAERRAQTAREVASWLHALGAIINLWLVVVALAVLVWAPDILRFREDRVAPIVALWAVLLVPAIFWLILYIRRFWHTGEEP